MVKNKYFLTRHIRMYDQKKKGDSLNSIGMEPCSEMCATPFPHPCRFRLSWSNNCALCGGITAHFGSESARFFVGIPTLPLFGFSLIAASLLAGRISQVACKAFPAFRSPYAGGLAPLAPDSSAGSWPSPVDTRLGILLHLSVSHSRRGRIHLMLRTARLFPH